jgi:hypothetical protein
MVARSGDQTKVHVSIEGRAGHLVIDGPLVLLRDLVRTLDRPVPARPQPMRPEQPNGPR